MNLPRLTTQAQIDYTLNYRAVIDNFGIECGYPPKKANLSAGWRGPRPEDFVGGARRRGGAKLRVFSYHVFRNKTAGLPSGSPDFLFPMIKNRLDNFLILFFTMRGGDR